MNRQDGCYGRRFFYCFIQLFIFVLRFWTSYFLENVLLFGKKENVAQGEEDLKS